VLYFVAVNENGQKRTRIFKNKPFARFARKNGILDSDLCAAVRDANRGLIAADLGGGVIKQRIARKGAGKSGGFRTIVAFRVRDLAVFIHGFAKNEADNIRADELAALKKLAAEFLGYRNQELKQAAASGTLMEVECNGESKTVS